VLVGGDFLLTQTTLAGIFGNVKEDMARMSDSFLGDS